MRRLTRFASKQAAGFFFMVYVNPAPPGIPTTFTTYDMHGSGAEENKMGFDCRTSHSFSFDLFLFSCNR